MRRSRQRFQQEKRHVWPVVLAVIVVVGTLGVVAVQYFDVDLPLWASDLLPREEYVAPPAVDPATVEDRTFELAAADTVFYFVDFERGLAHAGELSDVPGSALGAVAVDSTTKPSPPGVYFVANLYGAGDTIEVEPTDVDGFEEAVAPVAYGQGIGSEVALQADLMVDAIKLGVGSNDGRQRGRSRRRRSGRVQVDRLNKWTSWWKRFQPY